MVSQPQSRKGELVSSLALSNALVQLQAHYHHRAEAASEKGLSAATFVSQRAHPIICAGAECRVLPGHPGTSENPRSMMRR
jgi:hypothetical protein